MMSLHDRRTGSAGLFGLGLLLAICVFGATPAQAGMVKGTTVPAFTVEKGSGEAFRFPKDAEGKVVLMNFWASWCPECKIELPELLDLKRRYEGKPFLLLCVNMDRKRKAADKFLKKLKMDVPVLYDNDQKLVKIFRPVGVPASYLIGPNGEIEQVYIGFDKDTMDTYRRDIDALLSALEKASDGAAADPDAGVPGPEPGTGPSSGAGR